MRDLQLYFQFSYLTRKRCIVNERVPLLLQLTRLCHLSLSLADLGISGPGPNGTLICGEFQLRNDGENVYLFNPEGVLVSSTGTVPA
jgi:hypothetical protein